MRLTGLLIVLVIIFCSFSTGTYLIKENSTNKDTTANAKPVTKLTPPSESVFLNGKYLMKSTAISINGNSELLSQAKQRVWSGNGTKEFPILIQDIYFSDWYTSPDIVDIAISNTSLYFIIRDVYFEFLTLSNQPNARAGILLNNCSNAGIQNSYFISKIRNTNAHMIDITNCLNLSIEANYFNTTESIAITIKQSSQLYIASNFFKNNVDGINIEFDTNNLLITENNFLQNTWAISYSKGNLTQYATLNNSILSNNFENNTVSINIFGGNFGLIQGNVMQDPTLTKEAIYLQRALQTVIKDNYITGFKVGLAIDQLRNYLLLKSDCSTSNAIPECSEIGNATSGTLLLHQSNVTVIGNEFINQKQLSIAINNYTDGNMIYENNFIEPTINVSKAQVQVGLVQNNTNYFSNTGFGNYWTNYNGTDANNDGIGDTPYIINQNITDPKPLMNPLNISKPLVAVSSEGFYLTKLEVSLGGGTTIEITPIIPGGPVSLINSTIATNTNLSLNNFLGYILNEPTNLIILSTALGTLVVSMLLVYERRNYLKTNKSENFRNYIAKKIKRNKKETKKRIQLSDTVLEELEEIIDENKP